MSEQVEVKWSAEDGYVGRDRPKFAHIDAADFVNLTQKEAEELFDQIMEENFRSEVTWGCQDYEGSVRGLMEAAARIKASEEVRGND